MKKFLKIFGIILALVAVGVATYFTVDYFHSKETEQLTSQIASLNSSLATIGDITTCYTVLSETFPGQELTADLIVEQSIPSSFKNESFASADDLIGLYSKIAITPGTPITVDMVMTETIDDTTRDFDIVANHWPVGLREGDYVDLRIVYPLGEDFIVLSHKRVMELGESTLKLYLTEDELVLYQSALVDYFISSSYGSDLYITKYVEPGLQASATPFYSVPTNVASAMLLNPNIIDQASLTVEENMRAVIEAARKEFPEEDGDIGAAIAAGRNGVTSDTNTDFTTDFEEEQAAIEAANSGGESSSSGLITDLGGLG